MQSFHSQTYWCVGLNGGSGVGDADDEFVDVGIGAGVDIGTAEFVGMGGVTGDPSVDLLLAGRPRGLGLSILLVLFLTAAATPADPLVDGEVDVMLEADTGVMVT